MSTVQHQCYHQCYSYSSPTALNLIWPLYEYTLACSLPCASANIYYRSLDDYFQSTRSLVYLAVASCLVVKAYIVYNVPMNTYKYMNVHVLDFLSNLRISKIKNYKMSFQFIVNLSTSTLRYLPVLSTANLRSTRTLVRQTTCTQIYQRFYDFTILRFYRQHYRYTPVVLQCYRWEIPYTEVPQAQCYKNIKIPGTQTY